MNFEFSLTLHYFTSLEFNVIHFNALQLLELGLAVQYQNEHEERGVCERNWIDSTQDCDYWRDLVNAAMNLQFPQATEFISYSCLLIHYSRHFLGFLAVIFSRGLVTGLTT